MNNYDPTSKEKATTPANLIATTILTVFNITPVVVLILYSFRCFRSCLFKCRLNSLALTTFVEKFYGCYRDRLEGGKDMRSLSSLYFVLIYLIPSYHYLHIFKLQISFWSYLEFLFMVVAILVGYLKPYKKSYTNILDTILLASMSVFFTLLARSFFFSEVVQFSMMLMLPVIFFGLFVVLKGLTKFIEICKCFSNSNSSLDNPNQPLFP